MFSCSAHFQVVHVSDSAADVPTTVQFITPGIVATLADGVPSPSWQAGGEYRYFKVCMVPRHGAGRHMHTPPSPCMIGAVTVLQFHNVASEDIFVCLTASTGAAALYV